MPVVAVVEGITQEQYEESVRKVSGGKSRVESPSDWPVEGLLAHVAGQGKSGFRVVDVWESEEAWNKFVQGTIGPLMEEMGVQVEPEVYTVHTFVSA